MGIKGDFFGFTCYLMRRGRSTRLFRGGRKCPAFSAQIFGMDARAAEIGRWTGLLFEAYKLKFITDLALGGMNHSLRRGTRFYRAQM